MHGENNIKFITEFTINVLGRLILRLLDNFHRNNLTNNDGGGGKIDHGCYKLRFLYSAFHKIQVLHFFCHYITQIIVLKTFVFLFAPLQLSSQINYS
jgi:hypothetical protein